MPTIHLSAGQPKPELDVCYRLRSPILNDYHDKRDSTTRRGYGCRGQGPSTGHRESPERLRWKRKNTRSWLEPRAGTANAHDSNR